MSKTKLDLLYPAEGIHPFNLTSSTTPPKEGDAMKKNRFWTAFGRVLAVATVMLIIALMLAPGAWAANKYKVLYQFTGGADGKDPESALILDATGNLYGTTCWGGAYGYGTVFELTPNADGSWTESVLYSFTDSPDGDQPFGGLIFDASNNLYGTTVYGGDYGNGTVYELTPNSNGSWTESVLHSFNGDDGANPDRALIFDADGNLYGTGQSGGAYGHGVVFKLTSNPDGTWTDSTIHDFRGGKDGGQPQHGHLIFDAAGNLYGTTVGWFAGDGKGSVFELTPNADGTWTQTVLYYFRGGKDGYYPFGTLTFDEAGSLYGTTQSGGEYGGWHGTAFKLTPGSDGKWKKAVIHQFKGGKDGATPLAGLVFDTAGSLYGTTWNGGGGSCHDWLGSGCGTVFKLVPNSHGGWTEQMVHRFKRPIGNPVGEVVLDAAGNLYATADNGGSNYLGGVFEITP
jgi:uncharacterized repeat protein (TIGR03803 family)